MAACEIVRALTSDGRPELRAAPPHEPLASCAFEWPDGWIAQAPPWVPPPPFTASPLLRLTRDDGALDVAVARFGCEVDGLAFLEQWLGGPLEGRGWRGPAIALGRRGEVEWRVVGSGPAVHLLAATGSARALVDRAAATLRSLTGLGPEAEPVRPIDVGPLRCVRLAAWKLQRGAPPHGHHRAHLRLLDAEERASAYLRLHVLDRRVHVAADPHALLAATDADERKAGLVDRTPASADHGPGGPAERWEAKLGGIPVEVRRALRQIGPGLLVATAVHPTAAHAPLAWLNGRRHFDLALATLRVN